MQYNVIKFKPVPKITIWGGDVVKNYFGYYFFPDKVGQCWAFNALGKDSNIALDEFEGETLLSLFNEKPELFNSKYNKFPFIISLVGPVDDLSIQVHPDKECGINMGYEGGKDEAWYFIEAPENYNIVYGHKAEDLKDLKRYISDKKWDELINYLDINKEEAVFIPAGTLHAMRKDAVVYEVQQAVDVTFRFYDYDRIDENGKRRPLQTEQAIKSLHFEKCKGKTEPVIKIGADYSLITYIKNDSFAIRKISVNGKAEIPLSGYAVATVTSGYGLIDNVSVKRGDNCLITAVKNIHSMEGDLEILLTMEE